MTDVLSAYRTPAPDNGGGRRRENEVAEHRDVAPPPAGARGEDAQPLAVRSVRMFSPGPLGESRLWAATTRMAVVSLLVPVLVTGVLGAVLLSPKSGSLPPLRPGIDAQITRAYDATGAQIATFHRFDTSLPVAREDIPDVLRQAVVAAEDQRFYSHRGVDSRGILRALWADIRGTGYRQGASTITQQYVRLAYTGDRRTLGRKIDEAVLAGRVEDKMSKDEILYLYLSRAYFGGGNYGVGAAAESYFHKSVRDLTLSEAALLAGVLPSPSRYGPQTNPAEAETRRIGVLRKMADQGRITPEELNAASAQTLALATEGTATDASKTLVHPAGATASAYPWFADYLRRYLVARYGDNAVYQHGLRVETSLDPALQAMAEASVANALDGTEAPLDMAMVTIDPATGLVRAMVGGRDFARSQVNLALGGACPVAAGSAADDLPLCISGGGSGRQPGSSFKPFTLATALEQGFDADSTYYSGPGTYTYPGCSGSGCTVRNVESGSFGSISLRDATVHSVNTVYAQLIQDVGVAGTAELAHRLGLTMISPDGLLPNGEPYGPSLTLGAAEVSPLDMAAAYGVFAARGLQFPASPVVKVTDADGTVLEDNTARTGKRVLAADVADGVTSVLTDVVSYGTGTAADIGRPDGTAGKTGTSEGAGDAWFVGYTPSLVTSVWMGFADSRKPLIDIKDLAQVYGGTLPAQAWHDFMTAALETTPPQSFAAPRPPPGATATTTATKTATTTVTSSPAAGSASPVPADGRPVHVPPVGVPARVPGVAGGPR